MASLECVKCKQWDLNDSDLFCGYCGHLQVNIDIKPEKLFLITKIKPLGKFICTNSTSKDARLRFLWVDGMPRYLFMEPSEDFVLNAGSTGEVGIGFQDDIPSDFFEKDFKLLCVVNDNERQSIKLEITARTGPMPMAGELDFGEIKHGDTAVRDLMIVNKGAIPAKLTQIEIHHPCLQTEGKRSLPMMIPAGKEVRIPVRLSTNIFKPDDDIDHLSIELNFEHGETIKVPVIVDIIRIGIKVDPKKIDIPFALSKQNHPKTIKLSNIGTIDVDIKSISCAPGCSQWVEVISENKTFTLLSKLSVKQGKRTSPTILTEYSFKVVIRPQELNAGSHTGLVFIYMAGDEKPIEIPIEIFVRKPIPLPSYIGIDFGTTHSVVAFYDNEKDKAHVLEVTSPQGEKRSPLIPSVLVFDGSPDNYKIGWEAVNVAALFPELTIRSIKRIMGYSNTRMFYRKTFLPEDLAGCIMKRLIELAETEYFNTKNEYYDIKNAIVTVPTNFFDVPIRAILKACTIAGIKTKEESAREREKTIQNQINKPVNMGMIIDEPVAGALFLSTILRDENPDFYNMLKKGEKIRLLVYDHGGGTLDVSIIEVAKIGDSAVGLKVLAKKGDNKIGGDSIDLKIMNKLLEECKSVVPEFDDKVISIFYNELLKRKDSENWDEREFRNVIRARDDWKNVAEKIKVELSAKDRASFSTSRFNLTLYDSQRKEIQAQFNRALPVQKKEVETWIADILSKSQQIVLAAVDEAGLDETNIDFILHIGRTSLMPSIQERIKEIFPHLNDKDKKSDKTKKNRIILNEKYLKTCVAMGAAMYGAQMHAPGSSVSGILILEDGKKLPHSYGIRKVNFVEGNQFHTIIPKGESYPIVKEETYKNLTDNWLNLVFLQNSGNKTQLKDNPEIRKIGEILKELSGDSCTVRFEIDALKKLEVYADDERVEITPELMEDEARWIG